MKAEWIDIEQELPKTDTYVLVSFDNYSLADIARYEEERKAVLSIRVMKKKVMLLLDCS